MNAMVVNTMILQTSFLVGPAIGGFLIDHSGLATAYFASTLLFVPAVDRDLSRRTSGKIEGARRQVNLRSIVEGIEFIWIQRIILSLFLLDFAVVLVGFYRPILPIFAADVFKTGASGLGLLICRAVGGLIAGFHRAADGRRRQTQRRARHRRRARFFAGGLALLGHLTMVLDGGGGGICFSALPIRSASPSGARWFNFWRRTACSGERRA